MTDRLSRWTRLPRGIQVAVMQCKLLSLIPFAISCLATAGVYPPPHQEFFADFPQLIDRAAFVCKGEITSAPKTTSIEGPLPRMTGLATVHIDRCFKGTVETNIRIAADAYKPSGGWSVGGHLFLPVEGEYLLFFLKRKGLEYEIVDEGYGALPVSRLLATPFSSSDPLSGLEDDFEAGLDDPDHEMVLQSIYWLGSLRRLRSTREITDRLAAADPVERAYIWEALLAVNDLSVLPDVAEYLNDQVPPPHELLMPRDRIYLTQSHLYSAIFRIRSPLVLPYLNRFAESSDPALRESALQSLRSLGRLESAPIFLRKLDDHQNDIDFVAMQSLLELAGGGSTDWVPTWDEFRKEPSIYATLCRDWWRSEGEANARAQVASKMMK
jgi:hypothetical protein